MPTDPTHVSLKQLETMRAGARVAARTCMGIGPADRVFILTDRATHGIGRLLGEEASEAGGEVLVHDLEQYADRPMIAVPEPLRAELLKFRPTVTFFAASSQPGEVTFRTGLRAFILEEIQARHAHMPGITAQLMQEGMRTDYRVVSSVTTAVYDMARYARSDRVTTPDGTDLTVRFDPDLRWVQLHRHLSPGWQWGNLPEGETYTCPQMVDGTLVVHIIGDYFSPKYGVLAQPVTFTIRDCTRDRRARGERRAGYELTAYLDSAENGRRVGEFAVGTNVGLHRLTGNLLQDEKIPASTSRSATRILPRPARNGHRRCTWTSSRCVARSRWTEKPS